MSTKTKTKKVRILKSLWGKFNMPHPVGSDVALEEKQANELIKEGYAIPTSEAVKIEKAQAAGEGDAGDAGDANKGGAGDAGDANKGGAGDAGDANKGGAE